MKRRRIILLLICCGLILGVGLVLWWLTAIAPSWYAPPSATDVAIIELADRAEYRLVQEAQRIREGESPWTVRIREEQINAWLATRLRKWIEREEGRRWPEQLGTPQVRMNPDGVEIALPLLDGSRTRYLVTRFRPSMDGDALRWNLERVALGRLSLPGEPVAHLLNHLTDAAPQALDLPQIQDALEQMRAGTVIDPRIELADGRRIRLLRLQLRSGAVDVTAVTEANGRDDR